METSLFRFYSFGYVAAHKPLVTKEIRVRPVEILPYFDGSLKQNLRTIQDQGVDAQGKAYTVEVDADDTIEATWMGFACSNQETAPDVRIGERVVILQYGDVDKYYWASTGQDHGLRRLETVIHRWSDTTDETVELLTDTNSVTLKVSTHEGHIVLTTVKSNGEPYAYTIDLNFKEGNFTLKDDVGNIIQLDSARTYIGAINQAGTKYEMEKGDIRIKGQKMTIDVPEIITNSKTMTTNATTATFKISTMNFQSSAYNVTSTVTFTGPVKANGKSIDESHTHTSKAPNTPTSPVL